MKNPGKLKKFPEFNRFRKKARGKSMSVKNWKRQTHHLQAYQPLLNMLSQGKVHLFEDNPYRNYQLR